MPSTTTTRMSRVVVLPFERKQCMQALAKTRSIDGAAELLGISRRHLLVQVMKYQITSSDFTKVVRRQQHRDVA